MDDCELFDLGFSGLKFTWKNRQDAQSNVHVRLDRDVVNGAFPARFENFNVENVITTSSDHYAVVISLDSAKLRLEFQQVQHGFKYEAMWKRADDYKEVVESAWMPKAVDPIRCRQLGLGWDIWPSLSKSGARSPSAQLDTKSRILSAGYVSCAIHQLHLR